MSYAHAYNRLTAAGSDHTGPTDTRSTPAT
jgi:hypothetical protein